MSLSALRRPCFRSSCHLPQLHRLQLSGQCRRYTSPPTHQHPHSNSHLPLHAHTAPRGHAKRPRTALGLPAFLSLSLSLSCVAFTLGALYPPDIAQLLSPRPAPPPLAPSSPEAQAYTAELERSIQSLPVLETHRRRSEKEDEGGEGEGEEWYETRPYASYPEDLRVNHLTAGALRGPGKIAVPPILRVRKDEQETFAVMHLGRGLCGHEGIVHGGLIATILDESLGRVAIMNFPEKIGVTASLTVDYKAPTKADQFVVIRVRLVELKGRKAVVEGSLENLDGIVLASARALFIQPKYAKLLNTQTIAKAIGQPPVAATAADAAAAKVEGGDAVPVPALVHPEKSDAAAEKSGLLAQK